MAAQPTADSVRRAMEDKDIEDAGFGCLGVVLLLVTGVIFVLVWSAVNFWVGALLSGLLFLIGMAWLARKRYPR